MKIVECVQGSAEWWDARLGKPTCSKFDSILTPKTRKPSAGRKKYKAQLLADWVMGQYVKEWEGNQWTDRGLDLEPEARNYYAMMRDVVVDRPGFILRDDFKLHRPRFRRTAPGREVILATEFVVTGNH